MRRLRWWEWVAACLAATLVGWAASPGPDTFRFVILGDRTGETVAGVYEQVWREAAAEKPAFVVSVGDTIQGSITTQAPGQWREWQRIVAPYRRIPIYLAAGNHDVWAEASEQVFRKYAGHPPNYSFDYGTAHFTILDNSRSDELPPRTMSFLEQDLEAHASQPVKFIISHRPSWLVAAALGNRGIRIHQLAKKYGVRYVIAGHVHQLIHLDLDGVTYLSMESAGGHLRGAAKYEDGWFFGHTLVEVRGQEITFQIKELGPPHGQGRVTSPKDWGMLGLKH